jgi:hypothetical protein
MTSTDTVGWLQKEMQGAVQIGRPIVRVSGWPNPAEADPPDLTRRLDETDLKRAVDLAHRRGIADAFIVAFWNEAKFANPAGKAWMADFIYTLDNLPPGNQPVSSK